MCASACNEWWAAVVYNDGKCENVPVKNIKKFTPSHVKDFSVHQCHKIKSVKWNEEGGSLRFLGFIQRLAETEDDLVASLEAKRPHRPKKRFDLTDGPVTSTDCEGQDDLVSAERDSKNDREKRKRDADLEWASFTMNRRLKVDSVANKSATSQRGRCGPSTEEELRKTIRSLERELISERRRRIAAEERLKELGALSEVTKKLERVEERLNKMCDNKWRKNASPISSVTSVIAPDLEGSHNSTEAEISTVSTVDVINNKVTLGEGFFCLIASWNAMKDAKCVVDWCVAILRGVFGEEAKLYRVQPRKTSSHLKPFPKAFLEVAKVHFKCFLEKVKYDPSRIEVAVKKLPGMLADRATDMNGRRSK